MVYLFLFYMLIINAVSFLLMSVDKRRAIRKEWRIPERVLLFVALIGGSMGCLIGMHLLHHKTRKPLFYMCVPAMLAIHAGAIAFMLINLIP